MQILSTPYYSFIQSTIVVDQFYPKPNIEPPQPKQLCTNSNASSQILQRQFNEQQLGTLVLQQTVLFAEQFH